jgi:hypothetical protein
MYMHIYLIQGHVLQELILKITALLEPSLRLHFFERILENFAQDKSVMMGKGEGNAFTPLCPDETLVFVKDYLDIAMRAARLEQQHAAAAAVAAAESRSKSTMEAESRQNHMSSYSKYFLGFSALWSYIQARIPHPHFHTHSYIYTSIRIIH